MLGFLVSQMTNKRVQRTHMAAHRPLQDPPSSLRHLCQMIVIIPKEGRMTELSIRISAKGMGLEVRPDITASIGEESNPLR